MIRLVSILPFLVATSVRAQAVAQEQATEGAAGPIAITIFVLIFFGACVLYAWLTWRNEKKDRVAKANSEQKAAS